MKELHCKVNLKLMKKITGKWRTLLKRTVIIYTAQVVVKAVYSRRFQHNGHLVWIRETDTGSHLENR